MEPSRSSVSGTVLRTSVDRRARTSLALDLVDTPRPIELVRTADATRASDRTTEIEPRRRSEIINRVVNVFLASVALLVLSPVMILIALAVKLTSRAPAIYTQTRVGLDRRAIRTQAL